MKSIKLLLLSLALIANFAYPMAGVATCLKKFVPKHLGATTTALLTTTPALQYFCNSGYIKNLEQTEECLNNLPETQHIVKELLDTYANGQDVKIYSMREENKHYGDAYALTRSSQKVVCVGALDHDALKNSNDPQHYYVKGVIGHELGHVKNSPIFNTTEISCMLAASTGLYTFLKSSLFAKTPTIIKPLVWLSAVGITAATESITFAWLQIPNEYYADQNVIKHTKDPKILRAYASGTRANYCGNVTYLGISSYTNPEPHQDCLVRAQAFEKAADELEKRLSQQKSL